MGRTPVTTRLKGGEGPRAESGSRSNDWGSRGPVVLEVWWAQPRTGAIRRELWSPGALGLALEVGLDCVEHGAVRVGLQDDAPSVECRAGVGDA